ncbi:hypothetical protein IFM89_006861 [Coptis chinensis]|uniref:Uncharacterized protein n=1 Tax=Coptis chinensis TaxID=261450 RepID=A0A835GY11_9MAGN|nr:hypothetical protein IFM89_006861 [Coptis chinensis]
MVLCVSSRSWWGELFQPNRRSTLRFSWMKLWATNEVFLEEVKKVKKSNGQVLAINEAGIVGKYGARYGASLRKQIKKMEVSQHAKYFCKFSWQISL